MFATFSTEYDHSIEKLIWREFFSHSGEKSEKKKFSIFFSHMLQKNFSKNIAAEISQKQQKQKKLFFAGFLQFLGTYSALIDPPVIPVEVPKNAGGSRNFQVEFFFLKIWFWVPKSCDFEHPIWSCSPNSRARDLKISNFRAQKHIFQKNFDLKISGNPCNFVDFHQNQRGVI